MSIYLRVTRIRVGSCIPTCDISTWYMMHGSAQAMLLEQDIGNVCVVLAPRRTQLYVAMQSMVPCAILCASRGVGSATRNLVGRRRE